MLKSFFLKYISASIFSAKKQSRKKYNMHTVRPEANIISIDVYFVLLLSDLFIAAVALFFCFTASDYC